jgi:tRNA(Ile2) C34 agmatinyltransferase TiaS
MQLINAALIGIRSEYISAIRNWVCPACGGRMGGRAKEFQCQGQCGTDWREVWESVAAPRKRSR